MKRLILAAVSALALSSAPAVAQTVDSAEPTAEELAAIGGLFGDMFGQADELTAEQQARLPIAMEVVTRLMPEGTYARMMEESMGPMMDSIMGGLGSTPAIALSAATGISPLDLAAIEEERLQKALALLDPDAAARNSEISSAFLTMITETMNEIEPAYRSGLARAYAVRFTEGELADLNAYFQTSIGSKYAGESFLIFADPQVMASMNETVPAIMERMPSMMEAASQAEEKYPAGRSFSQLDASERTRLANLLGVTVKELEESAPAGPEIDHDGA